jgi:hypothetical protein
MQVIRKHDIRRNEHVVFDRNALQKAARMNPYAIANSVPRLEHGVGAHAHAVAYDVVLTNVRSMSRLEVRTNCGTRIHYGERPNQCSVSDSSQNVSRLPTTWWLADYRTVLQHGIDAEGHAGIKEPFTDYLTACHVVSCLPLMRAQW